MVLILWVILLCRWIIFVESFIHILITFISFYIVARNTMLTSWELFSISFWFCYHYWIITYFRLKWIVFFLEHCFLHFFLFLLFFIVLSKSLKNIVFEFIFFSKKLEYLFGSIIYAGFVSIVLRIYFSSFEILLIMP